MAVIEAAAEIQTDREDRARKCPRAEAGLASQEKRREAERILQAQTCETAASLLDRGSDWTTVEILLGVAKRTIHRWMERLDKPLVARGRPPKEVDFQVWIDLWKTMTELGPKTGVATLRRHHPDYPVAALRREKKRFASYWKHFHPREVSKLRWTRPGSVWAMDFGVPPVPLEGGYTAFLSVRDLPSRMELTNVAVYSENTRSVEEVILFLISLYGAPLVIKSDNGPAFISKAFRRLLSEMGVLLLLSPVRKPSYNGTAENAVNEVKTYAPHHAILQGRINTWTTEDLAWARERANITVGSDGLTRNERFDKGEPITAQEREAFRLAFRVEKSKIRRTMERKLKRKLNRKEHNTADRRALKAALIASVFLFVEGVSYSNNYLD